MAAKNAFSKIFNNACIHHCLTHYSATIHRLIVKENLLLEYNSNIKLNEAIRSLKSIVFTPIEFVDYEINKLEVLFASFEDFRMSSFFKNYLKRYTHIENEKVKLNKEYENYERIINDLPLTSNIAEAYNNAISKDLNYSKVNLNVFLSILIKRQAFIEMEINNALQTPFNSYQSYKQQQKMTKMKDTAKGY